MYVIASSLNGWGGSHTYSCKPASFKLTAAATYDRIEASCTGSMLLNSFEYTDWYAQYLTSPRLDFSSMGLVIEGEKGSLISSGKVAVNSFKQIYKDNNSSSMTLLDYYGNPLHQAPITVPSAYEEFASGSLPVVSINKTMDGISPTSSTSFSFRYDAPHDSSVYEVTAIAKHISGFEQVLMSSASAVTAEVTKTLTIPSTFPTGAFYIDFTIRSRKDGKIYQRKAYGYK